MDNTHKSKFASIHFVFTSEINCIDFFIATIRQKAVCYVGNSQANQPTSEDKDIDEVIEEIKHLIDNPDKRESCQSWQSMDLPDLRSFDVTDPIFMINFQDFKSRNKPSFKHPNVLLDGAMQINEKRVFLGRSFEFPKIYITEHCNTIHFDCEEIPLLINCVRTMLISQVEKMLVKNIKQLLTYEKEKLVRCLKLVGIGNANIISKIEKINIVVKKPDKPLLFDNDDDDDDDDDVDVE